MEVALDFTRLNNITLEVAKSEFKEPVEEKQEKSTIISLKPLETLKDSPREQTVEEIEVNLAKIKLKQQQEDHNRTLEVYREYQDNIKASECLRVDILKGVKAGEDTTTLFLKACKCISNMTSDKMFYSQIEKDIIAIRGYGLEEPIPLEWEKDEVKKRLEKLKESLQKEAEPEAKRRIETAIREHENKITQIQELLKAGA